MDYGALVKDTFSNFLKLENLIPLLVGSVIATFGSGLTLGILGPPLFLAYTEMCLNVSRGETVEIGDIFSGFSRFVSVWVLTLIVIVGVMIGTVLLVIPGIIFGVLASYSLHALADDPNCGAADSLRASFTFVKDNLVEVIIVSCIAFVIAIVLGITGIGAPIASAPIALLSSMFYVRKTGAEQATPASAF